MNDPAGFACDLCDKSREVRWLICRPCPVAGATIVRAGHADRCTACGSTLRDPLAGEVAEMRGGWGGCTGPPLGGGPCGV